MEPKAFKVKRTVAGSGLGLFTTQPIKKGSFVIEYTGKKIPTNIANEMTTKYLFEIDKDWTIDGSARSNLARYINHSCDSNCEAEEEGGRIMIYAFRTIAAGEELTYDYGDEYYDEFIKPIGCKCSAKKHY